MTKQTPAIQFVITFIVFSSFVRSKEINNSCKTYLSYFYREHSKECFYSSDLFKEPPELIEKYTGKSETHYVLTEDGYNLTVFRMPRENPRGIIVMQHALSCDCRIWMMQFNESTALFFWEAGYDIWMPNNRGSYYGRHHINLTRHDKEFWDYSFHEMGIYDHPACVDYIRSQTNGSKLIFITHSMSTTSTLIYASLKPDEAAESVKLMVQMSPAAIMRNVRAPGFNIAARYADILYSIGNALGIYSFSAYDSWYVKLFRLFIISSPFQFIVNLVISIMAGWAPRDADPKLYNMAASQVPSAASSKCYVHYGQMINQGNFQQFDYGREKNREIYNSTRPPLYPLGDIKVPQMLVYSKEDTITTTKDVEQLYKALPDEARFGKLYIKGINHVTFHLSKDRMPKIFKPILKALTGMENGS